MVGTPKTRHRSSSPLSPTLQISNTALVSYGTGKKLVVKPSFDKHWSLEKPKRVNWKGTKQMHWCSIIPRLQISLAWIQLPRSHNLFATMWLSQAPSNTWHVNCLLTQNLCISYMNLFQVQYNNQQMFKDFYWVEKKTKYRLLRPALQ
jgi:hypothetical protein